MTFKAIKPIPGQKDPYLARVASQAAALRMLQEAITALPLDVALGEIQVAIRDHSDLDGPALEAWSNEIRKIAWQNGA